MSALNNLKRRAKKNRIVLNIVRYSKRIRANSHYNNVEKYDFIDEKERKLYEAELPHYLSVNRDFDKYFCPRLIKGEKGVYIKNPRHYTYKKKDTGKIKIACVGDLMCEEIMQNDAEYNGKYNFEENFKFVSDILGGADLALGNLETTLCNSAPYSGESPEVDDKYHCNAPTDFLDALRYANFDAFALANNHNIDCGVNGIYETLFHLGEYGFAATGLFNSKTADKRYLIIEINGIKLALMSYSNHFNGNETRLTREGRNKLLNVYDEDRVEKDISDAKKDGAEFIICYIHWVKSNSYITEVYDEQYRISEFLAYAGADLIIGSHTHSLQKFGTVRTNDGRAVPVAYSMSNFSTSDRNEPPHTTGIAVFDIRKQDGKIIVYDSGIIPCYVFFNACGCHNAIIPCDAETGNENVNQKLNEVNEYVKELMGDTSEIKTSGYFIG